jgi:hypothetical protein
VSETITLDPAATEAALKAFHVGPPGVVRRLAQNDSYPGEHRDDPEAYVKLPTTRNDELRAIRDVIQAYLDHTNLVSLTRDELDAVLRGMAFVNTYFGPPPDPLTPGMTAQAKLERARDKLA